MSSKSRLLAEDAAIFPRPLAGAWCQCLQDFFKEEFLKHHHCLEQQREYYSDVAIQQAEQALSQIMEQMAQLCQRDDACEVMSQLLRKLDSVTNLSAWTEPDRLH